ncbi:MAG TPA: hypothetical protein VFM93_00260 [Candidatus Limnocylindria bacterium]|nr:hypothetical protein [Candidatus Limnocylindria bacterium]
MDARTCDACGLEIAPAATHWFEIGRRIGFLCPSCADDGDAVRRAQSSGADLRRGAIMGAAAVGVAAMTWYGVVVLTGLEVGIVATAVGAVVAMGVLAGAGPWRSQKLQWLSVGETLVALVLADLLITRHLLVTFVEEEYGRAAVALVTPAVVGEAMVRSIGGDIAILAFWAIALISAYEIPTMVRVHRPAAVEAASTGSA